MVVVKLPVALEVVAPVGFHDDGCQVKKDDDCSVTSAQGLAAGYLAQLQKGSKPSGAYVLR